MTLIASTAQRHFVDPFVCENVARSYDHCEIMAFESLMLTPFCIGKTWCKIMDISMFERCFQCDLGWNQVKICKNTSTFFIFYNCFADIPCFFLQGEINCWGGQDRKISALVSAPVSALHMTFGSQGWTALFDLADTFGPKV